MTARWLLAAFVVLLILIGIERYLRGGDALLLIQQEALVQKRSLAPLSCRKSRLSGASTGSGLSSPSSPGGEKTSTCRASSLVDAPVPPVPVAATATKFRISYCVPAGARSPVCVKATPPLVPSRRTPFSVVTKRNPLTASCTLVRALYLVLVLVRAFDFALNRALVPALVLVLDLALALVLARDLALALALVLARPAGS